MAIGTIPDEFERPATPHALDFTGIREVFYARDDRGLMRVVNRAGFRMDQGITTGSTTYQEPMKNSPTTGLATNREQVRARARRRIKKGQRLMDEAFDALYKPLEDWDAEELARGRPRNAAGGFAGRPPRYVTRELHERAMERFKTLIRDDMNAHSITALRTIQLVLESDEVDNRGKPIVPASTKLDAAKFLLEHIVGKAVQPTTSDISVKLQGIMAAVMVNPGELPDSYVPAHVGVRGEIGDGSVIDAEIYEDEEDELSGD